MDAQSPLDTVYRALESLDHETVSSMLLPDACLFSPEADGVHPSAAAISADLERRLGSARSRGAELRIRTSSSVVGMPDSRSGCWVFDQVDVEVVAGGVTRVVPVRITALCVQGADGLRIAAGYWSVPFATQEAQDAVKSSGSLAPGLVLDEAIGSTAVPVVEQLREALSQPSLLPALYSERDGCATIGSVVNEVFLGPDGRAAWQEFVEHVTAFEPRGPMRAQLVTDDLGWLAANIDIGSPGTPYRFFYIWERQGASWRVVVSHDAVDRDDLARC